MVRTPRFAVGDSILDRYLVLDHYSGAMGMAYLVEDTLRSNDSTTPSRMIAKTLRPDLENPALLHQFLDEASVWINLTPKTNVVHAYKVEVIERVPFVFAEFIRRGVLPNSLAEWIHYRLTPVEVALHFMVQIFDGLWYVYQDGVELHGDLKPSNILIDEDLIIKINDWGLARSTREPLTATQADGYAGAHRSSDYLAPEAMMSPLSITRALDGFAAGVLLGEMLTGKRFPAGTTRETIKSGLTTSCFGISAALQTSLAEIVSGLLVADARQRVDFYEKHGRRIAALYMDLTGIHVIDDSAAILIEKLPPGHAERVKSSEAAIESVRNALKPNT